MDVVSRLMKDRILLLGTEVTDDVSNVLVAQMLYLASADPETDITLYINSPGLFVISRFDYLDHVHVFNLLSLLYFSLSFRPWFHIHRWLSPSRFGNIRYYAIYSLWCENCLLWYGCFHGSIFVICWHKRKEKVASEQSYHDSSTSWWCTR